MLSKCVAGVLTKKHKETLMKIGKTLMVPLLLLVLPVAAVMGEGTMEVGVDAMPMNTDLLLTDPFLQLPTETSVNVVWFTEWVGESHQIRWGNGLGNVARARTTKLRSMEGQTEDGERYAREIWRHEATATGLDQGVRVPYFVQSTTDDGRRVRSRSFTLQPLPAPGQPLTILLTSDHQSMPNTAANLQRVVQTVGMVDAVFLAGDLVNYPDRSWEWFEAFTNWRGNVAGLFPALQGRADVFLPEIEYAGGEILQHAVLYPVIGNHEVTGQIDPETGLSDYGSNGPPGIKQPRWFAEIKYEEMKDEVNPSGDPGIRERWIVANSFNTYAYEDIFTLPDASPGGETYYAVEYGDVFLLGLYSTRPYRKRWNPELINKYQEGPDFLNDPQNWAFGDFLYEDLRPGSEQATWLNRVMRSPAYQNAKIRYLMAHEASRGAGGNAIPLKAMPVQTIEYTDERGATRTKTFEYPISMETWLSEIQPIVGSITHVRYDYPRSADTWKQVVEAAVHRSGAEIIHVGHSHVWWRVETEEGVPVIETSNVGNSYGAYLEGYRGRADADRNTWPVGDDRWDQSNYTNYGDPYGADLIRPSNFAPMIHDGEPMPVITSNQLSAFTILETPSGRITNYVFDATDPNSEPLVFDEFYILDHSREPVDSGR